MCPLRLLPSQAILSPPTQAHDSISFVGSCSVNDNNNKPKGIYELCDRRAVSLVTYFLPISTHTCITIQLSLYGFILRTCKQTINKVQVAGKVKICLHHSKDLPVKYDRFLIIRIQSKASTLTTASLLPRSQSSRGHTFRPLSRNCLCPPNCYWSCPKTWKEWSQYREGGWFESLGVNIERGGWSESLGVYIERGGVWESGSL